MLLNSLFRLKVFRYFISAGVATWVDICVYYIAFNYIYEKTDINISGIYTISAPTASLILSYTLGLITNFVITKYLVFSESELETYKQLFRYVLVALVVLVFNYLLMSFLIRILDWFPTISRAVSAITVGIMSFVVHRNFSFSTKNNKPVS